MIFSCCPEVTAVTFSTSPSCAAPSGTSRWKAGIRQFLDIGTGLPSADNAHEVAQVVAPESRVVYVDNDCCNSGTLTPPRLPDARGCLPAHRLHADGWR